MPPIFGYAYVMTRGRGAWPFLLGLALSACGSSSAGNGGGGASGTGGGGGADAASGGAGGSSASGGSAGACTAATPTAADCGPGGVECAALSIGGDPPADGPGVFRGYADPFLFADPAGSKRVGLAYSWPHIVTAAGADGGAVYLAAVENHLARSDDAGGSFSFVETLWPAVPMQDPEGLGAPGIISSETASIVPMQTGAVTTWYGAHIRYFLQPETGYHPRYGTSWHVRVGAASTPAGLAAAASDETVLGVSTTATVYAPQVRLNELAGLPIEQCAMLNNPTLFAADGSLYLIVECLAFVGTTLDFEHSTVQVFATTPSGAPKTWSWRYVGLLADHSLAVELGTDTIQQPDVSLASDGTPLLVITPAKADPSVQVGTVGQGCVAVQLDSIEPPKLARDCDGKALIRARLTGTGLGACTHASASSSGLVPHSNVATPSDGVGWHIHASKLSP